MVEQDTQRFGSLIGGVFRQWRRYVDDEFRAHGFTDATRAPIIALYDYRSPMRQTDLARRLGLDPSSLVRVLNILRKRGLVIWTAAPEDRRTKYISLTPEGTDWATRILRKNIEIERQLLADISESELQIARTVLRKIAARIPDS